MHKLLTAAALVVLLSACGEPEPTVVAPDDASLSFDNDGERILYALGVALGENVSEFELSDEEYAFVAAGLRDAALGADHQVDMDVFGPQIQAFVTDRVGASRRAAAEAERAAAATFAEQVAGEAGAERLDSGVVYVPVTEGEGETPTAADTVRVHYHGTLRDGTVFDSSIERGEPVSFPLGGVIPCWTEGVQRIRVGGKAKLLCPSDTAYGDAGVPGIPGGAALLFEVELLGIE